MIRFAFILLALVSATFTSAQERRDSQCIAIANADPALKYLRKASFTAPLPDYTVRLSYISHASFLIQTQGGTNAVTDFTGFVGNVDFTPDVVTMNHAHETHWTAHPDPAIPHVLKGWGEKFGEGVSHYLELGDMLVRNVSTDIRSNFSGREPDGNSIFIFEAEGLCIGHLGHLHHKPTPAQMGAIGRLDVVMAPVDGGMTLPIDVMIEVLKELRASVVIPMHWFSDFGLQVFLDGMKDEFEIDRRTDNSLEVSLATLPRDPTVITLRPRYLEDLADE